MSKLLAMMMNKKMPSRYQEVEYIEGDGNSYINTKYNANQDTTIKCRVSNTSSGSNAFIGCVNDLYGIGQQSSNNLLFAQYYTPSGDGRKTSVAGNDGVVRDFELRKNEFYIDNTLIGTFTAKTFTTANTLNLFTFNKTTCSQIKMYSAQILENNKIVRNYIPVYDTITQKYGMWESVQGKFCGNDGTGNFIGA